MMFADALAHGWRRTCLAIVLTAIAAVRVDAQDAGQVSTWARAVDAYLAGAEDSVNSVPGLSPDEVTTQSREALDAWMSRAHAAAGTVNAPAEWRLAIRRVQASALLPLEILSLLSTRLRLLPPMKAYEDASMDAWKRLGYDEMADALPLGAESRARQRRFRTWWQIAYLQFLMNNARYADFREHAPQVHLTDAAQTARVQSAPADPEATLHLGRVLMSRRRPRSTSSIPYGLPRPLATPCGCCRCWPTPRAASSCGFVGTPASPKRLPPSSRDTASATCCRSRRPVWAAGGGIASTFACAHGRGPSLRAKGTWPGIPDRTG